MFPLLIKDYSYSQREQTIDCYGEKEFSYTMKAVKTTVGRCDTANCSEPVAYAQVLGANRYFRYCEKHAPLQVKRQAELAAKQAEQTKK
jgi:hypothetical protein